MALWTADIDYEIVPGITSGLAAAACAAVPLTYRSISQSALFVTGHEAADALPLDWRHIAKAADTLVIHMGMARITEIQNALIAGGRHPDTPVLAMQWATLPQQRHVYAKLSDLTDAIHEADLDSPAILIVGEVVRLSQRLSHGMNTAFDDFFDQRHRYLSAVVSA